MEVQRESIFVSSLRSFCRLFFAVCGIFIALILCTFLYSTLAPTPLLQQKTNLEILPDAKGNKELISPTAPVILQISIKGVIGDPQNVNSENIQNILLDSRTGLLSRDRVKGILLYFNTPGGTVVDSENIYQMLKSYKAKYNVPIYAFVDGLCASGGMYIASAADQIFAGPGGVIGSVGVVLGPFFNFSGALETLKIEARTLTQGLDKDMMNPTRPWKEGEDASLKGVMAFLYQRFVDLVAEARPRLDKTKLIGEYGAQVFNSVEAQKLGYVDVAMTSRNAALAALLKAANIDSEKPYQVVELEIKRDWVSELVRGTSPLITGKVEHTLDFGQLPIRDQFAYLYQPLQRGAM